MTLRGHVSEVRSLAWSRDGKHLASGGFDRTVRIWDALTGKQKHILRGHTNFVQAVAWRPDSKRLASVCWDAIVKVWDPATGKETLSIDGRLGGVHAVVWSPDGKRLALTSQDRTVKVSDASTGKNTLTLRGHTDWVVSLAWSPDGKRLASASEDHTLKVWDLGTAKELLTLGGHTDWVRSVAWSPDGTRLASGGWDGTVRVWDAITGKETLTLRGHTHYVQSVAWSPDGTRLASAGEDGMILVHDATTGLVVERSPRLLGILDRRLAADPNNAGELRLRAEIHARRADWDSAAADIRRYLALDQGHSPRWFATGWWVAGPYPASLMGRPPTGEEPDPGGPVAWRAVALDANGLIPLGDLFGNIEPISVCAFQRVYSPRKQPVALLLGSRGAFRLWLNGKPAHQSEGHREASPAQEAVPASLEAGWNTLLVRAVSENSQGALYLSLSAKAADPTRSLSERER
jgi:hypothetical protein